MLTQGPSHALHARPAPQPEQLPALQVHALGLMQELVMQHLVFEQRLVVSAYEPGAQPEGPGGRAPAPRLVAARHWLPGCLAGGMAERVRVRGSAPLRLAATGPLLLRPAPQTATTLAAAPPS
jgi:hypothetical protein